jgi:hypothetical protein
MSPRSAWLRGLIVVALLALLGGRWLAVTTGNRLWAEALGATTAHDAIRGLARMLSALAFLTAAVWCIGNLHMVYRAIGSVQMKRRIGNIEIDEALPRRYLLMGAWGLGLVVAIAVSRGTGDWWQQKALAGVVRLVGLTEPVLGEDVGYYLFQLPWLRTLHGYVTLLAGVMLALTAILYAAVGAVRWTGRRLNVYDLARSHLGGLLSAFALVLCWGYQLEPAELVGGLQGVPYDGILADVRIPIAGILSVLAAVVAVSSALWMFVARGTWVAAAWAVLLGGSFLGHYVVPPIVASIGDPEARGLKRYGEAAMPLERMAFGLTLHDTVLGIAPPLPSGRRGGSEHLPALEQAPVWDGFAVTVAVNRLTRTLPPFRVYDATLDLYRGAGGGSPQAVYVAAREVDFAAEALPSASWADVHVAPGAVSHGVIAVSATRTTPNGLPMFIGDLTRPESLSAAPRDLQLADSVVLFSPTATEFMVVGPEHHAVGVAAGGFWRRLALAWTLQSPRLLTSSAVTPASVVLWERDVSSRLAAFAPFAQFGAAHPVVAAGRLVWVVPGYVAADAFPLTTGAEWRGHTIHALRAGFVGVVDAATGRTAVYLSGDTDPLSQAWAALAPTLVQPRDSLPLGIVPHIRYPEELFRVQTQLVHEREVGVTQAVQPALARARAEAQRAMATAPYWWTEAEGGAPLLRLRSVMQHGEPPFVGAVLDGVVVQGHASLHLTRLARPVEVPGPAKLAARVVADQPELAAIAGPARTMLLDDDIATLQTMYGATGPNDATRLAEVVVSWRGAVGSGNSIALALARAASAARAAPVSDSVWAHARRWFQQLDDARRSGDWNSFGRAYDELRRLLGGTRDSAR